MGRATPLIAVVDDDDDVRIALGRLTLSAGLAMEAFASGAEFLKSFDDHEPDCVVLDLHMPGMDGFEVQGELARRGTDLPVVVITGHDAPESRTRALALGACAFLCKPVEGEKLLAVIAAAMRARAD